MQWLKFYLLNRTTWWDASFLFAFPDDFALERPALLASIIESLKTKQGFQLFRDDPERKALRVGGIIFELTCDRDAFHVQVADQQISFRDARRLIEAELFRLIEKIETAVGNGTRQYALTAKFGQSRNPYLSTHLARMDDRTLLVFDCVYQVGDQDEPATVSIHKDSVTIVAGTRESFREASKRVLALSAP